MAVGAARNDGIDTIRGVSILLVLLHHFNIAYPLGGTPVARVFGADAVHALARNGNYGVTMFFVVSGYLITSNARARFGSLDRIRLGAFYRRRFARIAPCAWLLVLVVTVLGTAGVPIFGNHPETGPPVSFWMVDLAALTFWLNVLMARSGWLNYVLCAMWSLSVEEVFYLGFPLLCLAARRRAWLVAALLGFVVAGPVWRAGHQDDETGFLFAYLACFDGIAIGCLAAIVRAQVAPFLRPVAWMVRIAIVSGLAVLYLVASIAETNVFGVSVFALGTAGLVLLCDGPAGTGRDPTLRPVRASGRLSYELYLFHLLVLAALRTIWPPETMSANAVVILLGVYATGSAVVAHAVAHRFSEPANRWLRGGGAASGAAAAA